MEVWLKKMDRSGLRELYPTMKKDFPPAELKPLSKLEKLMRQGCYHGWFLMEDEARRGYALVQATPGCPYVLLDYLAMFSGRRGDGYGSKTLELLKQQYPSGVLAEAEAELPGQEEEENAVRRRRIAFYQKNGFIPCPFENSVFGVKYLVHLWTPEPVDDPSRKAARALLAHYRHHLPPVICRACVKIPGGE